MTRQGFFLLILYIVGTVYSYAVPAYPKKVTLLLQDGTEAVVQLCGDEHAHWGLTEDGYTILPTEHGWAYAMADSENRAIPSTFLLSSKNRDNETKQFLSQQPKNLKPYLKEARQSRRANSSKAKRSVTGNRRVLVVLVSFNDLSFQKAKTDFESLFNEENYSYDGAQGSVYDYYNEVSCGKLQLHSDILGPYKLQYGMSYYGGNAVNGYDKNPGAMFQEALNYAASQVNLSDYDADEDGFLDNLHIIFAGYGEEAGANSNAIWSHEGMLSPIEVQGIMIDRYSCTPELRGNRGDGISRIGVCCHEIGHALGAMDYYDTDYDTNGEYPGTGEWDVMGSGSWNNDGVTPPRFNPYVRAYDFGWVEVESPTQQDSDYEIRPSTAQEDQILRLETGSPGDFYLLENRIQQGFDSAIPGEGLMMYHVHPDINRYAESNTINAASPMKMYPVCASSNAKIPSSASSYGNINTSGCPFPGSSAKTTFGKSTTPAAFSWDGTEVAFSLSDIRKHADGNILFFLSVNGDYPQESKWQTIVEESFENAPFEQGWGQDDPVNTNIVWEQAEIGNNSNSSLIANWYTVSNTYDGKHYMSILHNELFGKCSTNLYSPYYSVSAEEMRISFAVLTKLKSSGSNKLVVNIEDKNSYVVKSQEISDMSTTSWKTINIELPESISKFRVVFNASVANASINIDYFCIQAIEKDVTAIPSVLDSSWPEISVVNNRICVSGKARLQPTNIFNASGTLVDSLYGYKTQSIKLPSGLYIIKMNNHNKKIYIP